MSFDNVLKMIIFKKNREFKKNMIFKLKIIFIKLMRQICFKIFYKWTGVIQKYMPVFEHVFETRLLHGTLELVGVRWHTFSGELVNLV